MKLIRCRDQGLETLDEFYLELGTMQHLGGIAKAMLDLIARLRELPDDRTVFGLTSHQRLILLPEDTYQSPWFVIISASDTRNYLIEYLMPKRITPWKRSAYIRREACSKDEALEMIIKALNKCEGWDVSQ